MSFTLDATDSPRRRTPVDGWAIIGLYLMIFDTLWGAFFVGGIGFEPVPDVALVVSFLAGAPAYALDMWIGRRVIVFLPALYLFRWLALSHIQTAPYGVSQSWRGSLLLIVASVLLQWSKLRRR
jgi:hypothetical protein